MRFTRIKVTEKIVELDWFTKKANGEKVSSTLEGTQRPVASLLQAMAAFRDYVVELLDAPIGWDLRVTTLNVDEGKDGRRGLIVTCVRPVEKAQNRVLVLNTPRMSEGGEDSAPEGFLSDDILSLIASAELAATGYVNGEREQTELALSGPEQVEKADAESAQRKPSRRRSKSFVPEVGDVVNPDATVEPTDDVLRSQLAAQGRDVPLEAVGRWINSERSGVRAWLLDPKLSEPPCLERDATPTMFDEHAVAADGDAWTQEAPPPKAADVAPVVT